MSVRLVDDLRWYRRVFLPSLRLIWRGRPRHRREAGIARPAHQSATP